LASSTRSSGGKRLPAARTGVKIDRRVGLAIGSASPEKPGAAANGFERQPDRAPDGSAKCPLIDERAYFEQALPALHISLDHPVERTAGSQFGGPGRDHAGGVELFGRSAIPPRIGQTFGDPSSRSSTLSRRHTV
jgi:hypothetical protein